MVLLAHDPDDVKLTAWDKLYELITKIVTGTSGQMKVLQFAAVVARVAV